MLELFEVDNNICKTIVESHEDILIAAIIENLETVQFHLRPSAPIPEESRNRTMILQTQIISSMLKQNQDYLGEFSFIHIHTEKLDVVHIPLGGVKILATVIKPQKVNDEVISSILKAIKFQEPS